MYNIKNLTNEVQYLFFNSGKECFIAGKDILSSVRDSEITPVILKMKDRKILALEQVKTAAKAKPAARVSSSAAAPADKTATQGKSKPRSTTKPKK